MKMGAWIAGAAALALLAGCNKAEEKAANAPEAGKEAVAAAPAETAMPARKAGLWNQTIATGDMTQTMKLCLDVATAEKISAFGQQTSQDVCSEQQMTKRLDGGWDFASTCDMGPQGKIVSKGTATGDFTSKYQVKATSTTTGATMAQANGTHEMTMTAEWVGPCPAGMKPGDLELPGGMRMNITQMGAAASGGGQ